MMMVAALQLVHHGFAHLHCGLHVNHFHSARRGQIHGPGNQHHARASRRGFFGQRVAHFSARPIGDVAHRVQRLLRRPGGDQQRLAVQIATVGDRSAPRPLPQSPPAPPACPARPCRKPAAPSSGSTITWPRSRKYPQVLLRRRVIPHVGVHRRRQHHGSGEREIHRGQKIVGEPVREFREQIRSSRRDHQNLVLLRHADVFDRARQRVFSARCGKQAGDHFASGERGEASADG